MMQNIMRMNKMAKNTIKKKDSAVESPVKTTKNKNENKRIEISTAENGWIVRVSIEKNDGYYSTTYIASTEKELASILASVR